MSKAATITAITLSTVAVGAAFSGGYALAVAHAPDPVSAPATVQYVDHHVYVPRITPVTEYVERVEYRTEYLPVEVPVYVEVPTTVTEYVNVPTYEIDPVTGEPITAQMLWDRELSAYNAGVADSLEACPTEDSDNCYWDAAIQGNGQGVSFINIGGSTYYKQQ